MAAIVFLTCLCFAANVALAAAKPAKEHRQQQNAGAAQHRSRRSNAELINSILRDRRLWRAYAEPKRANAELINNMLSWDWSSDDYLHKAGRKRGAPATGGDAKRANAELMNELLSSSNGNYMALLDKAGRKRRKRGSAEVVHGLLGHLPDMGKLSEVGK